MSFFGPIWQSRNKNKIERYIQKKPNEEQLAEIAVKCFFPDLRLKAARSLMSSGSWSGAGGLFVPCDSGSVGEGDRRGDFAHTS